MTAERNGEVVTFFSFKGGTGRTMALANIAWILASRGKRVLVIDWDLDSPGLHKFYAPFLDAELYDSTEGIVDIISDFAREATHAGDRREDWHLRHARVVPHALSINWSFPGDGVLDIISAGRPGHAHSAVLPGFSWDNFYYRLGGGLLFSAMRDDMRRNYDYTLIDSRTGLSDIAGICTVRFPDVVVNCFTLSNQSVEGAARVARSIDDLSDDRDIRILPVPMRVEDAEKAKLDNGLSYARGLFAGYPSGLDREARERYWGTIPIPYRPYYAYEEVLATFADDPRSPLTLLAAYERLASVITGGEVREAAEVPEEARKRVVAAFERRRAAPAPDVFLSYAPEDRMWADWVSAVLRRAGVRVKAQGSDFPPGAEVASEVGRAVSAAGYTVALLSPAYVRSSQARALWEVLATAESSGSRRPLVPLRVAEVRLEAPFDDWSAIDLVRLEETDCADTVLRALELRTAASRDDVADAPVVRFPGARPPVWSVPTRNASFTGRSALLQKLRDELSIGKVVVEPLALHGLGGVGKTQLVIEYAHRFMADYDVVWWISAQQEDLIAGSLAEIGPALGIRRGESIDETAAAVLEALRRGEPYGRWLIIFDNAEDPDTLQPYLPQGNGHVIITSRNPAWAHLATPVEVEAFTRAESVEHLTRRVPALALDAAEEVAKLLGDLPLAIELASAWLETTGMPVPDYMALLDTQLATWLASSTPRDYASTAAATWSVSIDRLRLERPAAVRLLELCSCFGPEPISMSLLYSDETLDALLPYDASLQEKMMLGRVIREIGRYALARLDSQRSSIEVHRLVQAVVRDSLTAEQVEQTQHEVHRILVSARPRQGDIDNPENWPRYNEIWPHLVPSQAHRCTEDLVRGLLVERVRYLWLRGEYDDGLALGRQLEEWWLAERGPDDRLLLYLRFHVANILRSTGDYQGAYEVDSDVLSRQTAAFGREYVHSLMTANGLTADLIGVGRHRDALELARRTTETYVEQFGEDYQLALNASSNLALCLRANGDYVGGREVDRRTYALRSTVLGPSHPQTLLSAQNLARDLRHTGEFTESTALLRSALERQRLSLGSDFPDTRRTVASLSISLRKSGRHEEALRLSTDLLAEYEQSGYAVDHPDVLACRLYVASDLAANGDYAGALAVSEGITAAYERSFGRDHQFTLVSANNRSIYLRLVGRVKEGREVVERTYASLCVGMGEDHPVVLFCAMNVASAQAEDNDLDAAELLERRTETALARALGERHPETLFCRCNLAVTLRALGRTADGQDLMQQSLRRLEVALGADHPHLDPPRRWKRVNRDLEPPTL